MSRILLVEDEVVIRMELRRLLARHGHDVVEAGSIAEAEEAHDLRAFDLVLADVRLPGAPGTELVGRCGGAPVVLMTSYATVKAAVDAVKRGAADYLSKPFDHAELVALVDHHLAGARAAQGAPAESAPASMPPAPASMPPAPASMPPAPDDEELEGMIGGSAAMREVFARVRKVAPSEATLLVLGESGTGKETLARAVHRLSPRRQFSFVRVHCAAIPEGLIEGELFGYERGAFPGALSARAGLCEAAEGGTLLLDEIAELPARVQARLLRFLQTGEVRRVGAAQARRVDVRLIAATQRDLVAMVREGSFLSDLYFRLRVLEIRLPPLRERPGDSVRIAESLLTRRARATGQRPLALSPEARAAIAAAPWPGNVRELENAIHRAMVLAEGSEIGVGLLGLDDAPQPAPAAHSSAAHESEPRSDSLEGYFRRFVLEHQHELTETEIARRLGISRKALWERRQRLGIPRPR
ncbi:MULTISPECIES: sigma-54 dependent transcriptional regulator [Sorangium]|uniref:Fis family transcriptional regulator n=1 Tax=Sorangium cellulosum TaxID=56 RepID=A0A4P2QMK3_SORCE|nr:MULTISPECIES: sigma-54 dependent transcriptional regulator [Sorangium]AUX31317.1 Fis family transcriptional regulator [Sorangium cellulosum]WCQ90700.1 Regulatory protein AtoC [Sorangium sp. Soce836]